MPDIIYGLLILLFVYAAFSKLFDYAQFKIQLGRSPLIASYVGIIVWLLPTIELIIAVMLTAKVTRITGVYSSFTLLLLFTLYTARMVAHFHRNIQWWSYQYFELETAYSVQFIFAPSCFVRNIIGEKTKIINKLFE